jgi:high affinity Mn2+ porin
MTYCKHLENAAAALLLALSCGLAAAQDQDERWNAYGQATYIRNVHGAFPAAYTNLNGSSATATAFLGVKPWSGGELFFAPEMIAQVAFSDLAGLGGSVQNAELEKTGFSRPIFYTSRLFLCQT